MRSSAPTQLRLEIRRPPVDEIEGQHGVRLPLAHDHAAAAVARIERDVLRVARPASTCRRRERGCRSRRRPGRRGGRPRARGAARTKVPESPIMKRRVGVEHVDAGEAAEIRLVARRHRGRRGIRADRLPPTPAMPKFSMRPNVERERLGGRATARSRASAKSASEREAPHAARRRLGWPRTGGAAASRRTARRASPSSRRRAPRRRRW